ncbi:MAG: DUF6017 domain-containing protein [Mogibacterium sp.]|nr:DUF6017 domain-containing protein [Mogibacterium sp.]
MGKLTVSGNMIVDAMGEMKITGDIVPLSWYREITFRNGRPDFGGAAILANLVYWYRPSVKVEENTGNVVWKKKFRNDYVQMGYAQIEERFNLSRDQAKDALRRLEERGLIRRHFRTVDAGGIRCNNVMFLEIIPKRISEITYPTETEKETENGGCIQIPEGIYPYRSVDIKNEDTASMHPSVVSEPVTNTKNITENINKDYPYINQIRERFMEQIDYFSLISDYPLSSGQIDEIVEIATEILASDRSHIKVNGENQPIAFVQDRFRQLRMGHIQYVLNSLKEYKGGASNIRGYLITTLFNAPATMDTYYGIKVNHDLANN